MKRSIIGASLFLAPLALATPIPLDLGPNGIHTPPPLVVAFPLPAVQFQGQNISIDFVFQNSEFIRLFTQTKSFELVLDLGVNNAPFPQVFAGTGYVSDSQGSALGPATTLQVSTGENGAGEVNVAQFVLAPLIGSTPPVDIYDIHFDLTLPDSPSFGFRNQLDEISLQANIFGVGPHVPADVIPETGDAIGFLALGLIALLAAQRIFSARVVRTVG